MGFEQVAIFVLLAGMMVAFATVRRLELVALGGLAIGTLLGLVPIETVFSGFSSPVVITVIEILLIVDVLKRSSLLDTAAARLSGVLADDRQLVVGLCAMGALLSVFMNNIGALALMVPLAISLCERQGVPLEKVLMPLSFATLLGGLCSMVGTPSNLLGAVAVGEVRGQPLGFFELSLVGVPLTLAGLAYLWLATPRGERTNAQGTGVPHGRNYVTELTIAPKSPMASLSAREATDRHDIVIHNQVRAGNFVFGRDDREILVGDTLVVEGPRDALAALGAFGEPADAARMEAVVLPESIYVGSAVEDLVAFTEAGATVIAAGITPRRIEGRLADVRLSVGDIVVLEGDPEAIARECTEGGLLQLAPAVREARSSLFPIAIFGLGVGAAALFGIDPSIAFGAVVLALALSGHLSLRKGLEGLNWPIIILLGAMIPLGNAVATTGAAGALAEMAAGLLPGADLLAIVAIMLGFAIVLTPFVNNPTTVVALAPVGVALADQYGLPATPIIIAITVGASLDFLTPIGHHNNTLVMGIAGYRFIDYARLGWPLVLISALLSLILIPLFFH